MAGIVIPKETQPNGNKPVIVTAHVQAQACGNHTESKNIKGDKKLYKGEEIPEGIKCDMIQYQAYGPCVFIDHLPTRIMDAFSYLEYPLSISKTYVQTGVAGIVIKRYKERIVQFRVPTGFGPKAVGKDPAAINCGVVGEKSQHKKLMQNTLRFHFSPAALDYHQVSKHLVQGFEKAFSQGLLKELRVGNYDVANDVGVSSKHVLVYRPYTRKVKTYSENGNNPSAYMNSGRSSRQFMYYDKVQHMEEVKSLVLPQTVLTRFEHREKLCKPILPYQLMSVGNPFDRIEVFFLYKGLPILEAWPVTQTLAAHVKLPFA